LGQRSRKRRRPAGEHNPVNGRAATEREAPPRDDAMARRYARSRERDAAVRAALEPLAPGERPLAVTTAAVFATVVAIANLVAAVLSHPTGPEWRFVAIQCAVLLIAAVGMWRVKYWAVLGFQVLLGLTVLLAFLALLRAGDVWALLLVLAVVVLCSVQFWFLIRAMARIQMPERARRDAGSSAPR
jgi:hypothetical protein